MVNTTRGDRPQLVLLTGPIASGKTTVAFELAAEARRCGRPAAAIDIDDLVAMVAGTDWSLVRRQHRELSWTVASTVIDKLFEAGTAIVACAGSTLSPDEWDEVLRQLGAQPETCFVLLKASLPEAVRRAQADPTRVATRNAEVVERLYSRIDWGGLRKHDLEVETDELGVDEVVALLARRVLSH